MPKITFDILVFNELYPILAFYYISDKSEVLLKEISMDYIDASRLTKDIQEKINSGILSTYNDVYSFLYKELYTNKLSY